MPNVIRNQTVHLGPRANPDTFNESELARMGELGLTVDFNDRQYQIVKLDSGPSASTGAGVVAANQLAFWKDRSVYLVTNDANQAKLNNVANSFRNNVAGIFRTAVTSGYYCFVLQRGRRVLMKDDGSTTGGMTMVAEAGTVARASGVAIATAPQVQQLGVAVASSSGGNVYANVDIADIP